MTKLSWDNVGKRIYETGIDRGVLYPKVGQGVAWNGLISVNETPTGGEAIPHYLDGVKFVNEASSEEFEATIEAFTYPDEFSKIDGSTTSGTGLSYSEQAREEFGLSYRTKIGNDLVGTSLGYKIHLVYNALASPTDTINQTVGDSPEAMTFRWSVTTTPERIQALKPTSHLTIDSTKTDIVLLTKLETILYGSYDSSPRLPSISEVVALFDDWSPLEVVRDIAYGFSPLIFQGYPDIKGDMRRGLYSPTDETRLTELETPGLYSLVM